MTSQPFKPDVLDPSRWDLLPLLDCVYGKLAYQVDIRHFAHHQHGAVEVAEISGPIDGRVTVTQHAFGLMDPASPLPEAYVEAAISEDAVEGRGPWTSLLDSVSQPFVVADWKAWRQRFDGPEVPVIAAALLRECRGLQFEQALRNSGFCAHGSFSCDVVRDVVGEMFDADCGLEEFVPEWINLSDRDCSSLTHCALGSALLGTRVLAADGAARLSIRAASWASFNDFLSNPQQSALGQFLRRAGQGRVSWIVNLECYSPPLNAAGAVNNSHVLGVNSWLASEANKPSDYKCELRMPQFGAWAGEN